MAGLQFVDIPGYSALLLRRTFPELSQPGGLIPKSHEWLSQTDATWNERDHRWTFPSGATLSFGYLDNPRDKYRYQGSEYQFIGVDEMTHFLQEDVIYLFSRLRRLAHSPVPIRFRGASNPGGRGHEWVKARYINPATREDRIFIPAKLGDNPSLDQAAYEESLAQLDPQTRAQLLDGDWDARPRGLWVLDQEAIEAVEAEGERVEALRKSGQLVPDGGLRLSVDWGQHSHLLLGWPTEAGGMHIIREWVFDSAGDAAVNVNRVAEAIAPVLQAEEFEGMDLELETYDAAAPGLNAVFMERLRDLLGYDALARGVPFNKFKRPSIDRMRMLAANTRDGNYPRTSYSRAACPVLATQLRGWEYADEWTGEVKKGDDHGPDSFVALLAPGIL